jgi:hypothetical protein
MLQKLHLEWFLLASRAVSVGLQVLVARTRQEYCSMLYSIARSSETAAGQHTSSAAAARQTLLATHAAHAVWDVHVQANTFLVRLRSLFADFPRCVSCCRRLSRLTQTALKMLYEARMTSKSSHLVATHVPVAVAV